ncbi:MAG: cation transporter [Candidatus Limnocylindria bacterium]
MATETQSRRQPIQFIDLGVGRMTCDDCVQTVTSALEAVPGVKSAEVSLTGRSAHVAADPSVDTTQLTAAVRASGYNAFVRGERSGA